MCVYIQLIDDQSFEKLEYFSVHLMSEPDVMIHNPYTMITIYDDEGKAQYFLPMASFALQTHLSVDDVLYHQFITYYRAVVRIS